MSSPPHKKSGHKNMTLREIFACYRQHMVRSQSFRIKVSYMHSTAQHSTADTSPMGQHSSLPRCNFPVVADHLDRSD